MKTFSDTLPLNETGCKSTQWFVELLMAFLVSWKVFLKWFKFTIMSSTWVSRTMSHALLGSKMWFKGSFYTNSYWLHSHSWNEACNLTSLYMYTLSCGALSRMLSWHWTVITHVFSHLTWIHIGCVILIELRRANIHMVVQCTHYPAAELQNVRDMGISLSQSFGNKYVMSNCHPCKKLKFCKSHLRCTIVLHVILSPATVWSH